MELIIAMLVLSLTMTAIAPAFYGELKAAAATDYRSTANGLAVAATEQMRAFPYWQVGWDSSDYSDSTSPAHRCIPPAAPSWNSSSGQDPVDITPITTQSGLQGSIFDAATNNLYATERIAPVTYTITRCVYWMADSTGNSDAFKETWVGVSWTIGNIQWHVTQTSALYPGGVGTYSFQDNDTPTGQACTNNGTLPATPTGISASVDGTYGTQQIDLAWSEPTTNPPSVLPLTYEVEYSSSSAGPWIPFSQNGLLYADVDGLSAGLQYWFEVWAIACDGTPSASAATATQSTQSQAQSCDYSNFQVSPSSTTIGTSDQLDQISSFQISVQVSAACNNVAVEYSPKNNGTFTSDSAPSGAGSLSWQTSATKWAAGTIPFYLYIGGSQVGAPFQVQITCDAKKC